MGHLARARKLVHHRSWLVFCYCMWESGSKNAPDRIHSIVIPERSGSNKRTVGKACFKVPVCDVDNDSLEQEASAEGPPSNGEQKFWKKKDVWEKEEEEKEEEEERKEVTWTNPYNGQRVQCSVSSCQNSQIEFERFNQLSNIEYDARHQSSQRRLINMKLPEPTKSTGACNIIQPNKSNRKIISNYSLCHHHHHQGNFFKPSNRNCIAILRYSTAYPV